MRTLPALMLALLAWSSPAAAQMPFPLWRSVGGTNYDLQPLYSWRSDMVVKTATRQYTGELERERPYSEWIGANLWEHFTVKEVRKPDLLLLDWQAERGSSNTTEVVLQHYPRQAGVSAGQRLEFFACPSGRCSWTNQPGSVKTLPLFDFGTPCPAAQKVAVSSGRSRAGT